MYITFFTLGPQRSMGFEPKTDFSLFFDRPEGPAMEKAYKIAYSKLRVCKISTQNMCKNAQNCTKKGKKYLIKLVKTKN